jgi:hypothetical protein
LTSGGGACGFFFEQAGARRARASVANKSVDRVRFMTISFVRSGVDPK